MNQATTTKRALICNSIVLVLVVLLVPILVLVVLLILVVLDLSCTVSISKCQYWTGLGYRQFKTLKGLGLVLVFGLILEN